MSKGLDYRVVCLLALVVCLGPAARDAAAQQPMPDAWVDRQLFGCSFRHMRNALACVTLVTDLWSYFAMDTVSRVSTPPPATAGGPAPATAPPSSAPRVDPTILRDGNWIHPTAKAFRTIQVLARAEIHKDTTTCGPMLSDRRTLIHVMCEAQRQLLPSGSNNWSRENQELRDLRKRLGEIGCLPPAPVDPCAIPTGPAVVAELLPSDSGVSDLTTEQTSAETVADFN